jgi:general stress protein 26
VREKIGTLRETARRMATHTKSKSPGSSELSDQTNGQKHLYELLKEFPTVMLGTFEQTGQTPSLVARPMSVSQLDPSCKLTFITGIDTSKVDEALRARAAHVIGQSKTRFFTVRGQIRVLQDRARIHELWSKLNDVWFDGPDDPTAALMEFYPEEAELWDVSGTNGLRFVFEAAKALITGQEMPKEKPGQGGHDRFPVNS